MGTGGAQCSPCPRWPSPAICAFGLSPFTASAFTNLPSRGFPTCRLFLAACVRSLSPEPPGPSPSPDLSLRAPPARLGLPSLRPDLSPSPSFCRVVPSLSPGGAFPGHSLRQPACHQTPVPTDGGSLPAASHPTCFLSAHLPRQHSPRPLRGLHPYSALSDRSCLLQRSWGLPTRKSTPSPQGRTYEEQAWGVKMEEGLGVCGLSGFMHGPRFRVTDKPSTWSLQP